GLQGRCFMSKERSRRNCKRSLPMRIHLLIVVLLSCLGVSHAQQRPGLAGDKQAPGMQVPTPSPPGEQDTSAPACQADLARLQKLIADQRSYIALLEQKVQSLQPPTQPATGKGKTP
ncbi:MAG TPA: hypothetical protein VKP68_11145, partial [Ramlibacter sp.]|nr:hypothetical protein [Ramlibacter sp.]